MGKMIREERKRRGWTQADLAERCGRSRSLQPTISVIEQGRPQSNILMSEIAKVLDLDLGRAALQDFGIIGATEAAIMDDPALKRAGKVALLSVYAALTGRPSAAEYLNKEPLSDVEVVGGVL